MRLERVSRALLAALLIAASTGCASPDPEPSGEAPATEAAAEEATAKEATTLPADLNCADQDYVQRPGAAKDAFTSPTNFLRCTAGKYALCYYSGASPLPCDPSDQEGTSNCQCQVYEASTSAPMYVEIGGILNQCVYDETVAQCGADGSGCQNICIDKPGAPGCTDSSDAPMAVACDYIANNAFNPDAEFISTFSFAEVNVPNSDQVFSLGSNSENGQYAGCMTAPCSGETTNELGQSYTTCACPLWPTDGSSARYQFGRACTDGETNPDAPGYCTLDSGQVWSAAVNDILIHALVEHETGGDSESE